METNLLEQIDQIHDILTNAIATAWDNPCFSKSTHSFFLSAQIKEMDYADAPG